MFLNKFTKIITLFLIIIIVFVSVFSLKTQKTEALGAELVIEVGANLFSNMESMIKEIGLDSIAWYAKDIIVRQLVTSTVNWINSGFEGSPAYITDFEGFLTDVGDDITGQIINETGLNFLCDPFALDIRLALENDFMERDNLDCKLSDVVDNIGGSIDDISNTMGENWDWDAWISITQNSSNNPFSSYIDTSIRIQNTIFEKEQQQSAQIQWADGYISIPFCETQEVEENGTIHYNKQCQIKTPGKLISESLNEQLSWGGQELISADEIDEIVSALLAQLLNQILTGDGGLRGVNNDGYLDDMLDDNSAGSGTVGNIIKQIERDIKEEQKYLDVKKATMELLVSTKTLLESARDVCSGSSKSSPILNKIIVNPVVESELTKWINDVIKNQIQPLIDKIQKDIDASQKIIDRLKEIIEALKKLKLGEIPEPSEPPESPEPPTPDPLANYTCEKVIAPSYTRGFFSLASFKNQLFAGAFGYNLKNQSMMFGLGGAISPGLKNITESVCVMKEYDGFLYVNSEQEGLIFRSQNGRDWVQVYDLNQPTGCAMTTHNNNLFAVGSNGFQGQRKSVIYKFNENEGWKLVYRDNNLYVRDIVSYNGKIYAFGVDNNNQGYMISSDTGFGNWTKIETDDRFFRATVIDATMWLGSSLKYSNNNKSGIFKYNGNTFVNVYSTTNYEHITYVKRWEGFLFAGTTKGFKISSKGGKAKGPTQLLFSVDNGVSWKTACTVQEEGIWDLVENDGKLYIATVSFNGTQGGSVYEVKKK
ncbi:MAG: hypothetical protein PHX25_03105 [Candidatus Pacebacteria bacterium]|nr:hypothetical protein [Candidatus Paceibacterota bacterium]